MRAPACPIAARSWPRRSMTAYFLPGRPARRTIFQPRTAVGSPASRLRIRSWPRASARDLRLKAKCQNILVWRWPIKIRIAYRTPEVLSPKTCFLSFLAAPLSISIFERRCILVFCRSRSISVRESNRLLPRKFSLFASGKDKGENLFANPAPFVTCSTLSSIRHKTCEAVLWHSEC
jgi:hypothetical protein